MNQKLVDFYSDAGHVVLNSIKARYESQGSSLPPFVVKHRAMSDDERAKLKPAEFALSDRRLFPICSKAETWKSIAYFNVLKTAALSPASAGDREEIRSMLAKAASLWGLEDPEVEQLVHDVTLALPKKASAEDCDGRSAEEWGAQFLKMSKQMPEPKRRELANRILRAAESEEIDEDVRKKLLKHAGAATCTVDTALELLNDVIPQIPVRSDYHKPFTEMRSLLFKRAGSELMDSETVSDLVAVVEKVDSQYHLRVAAAERLRAFDLEDAEKVRRDISDTVTLPGGIMAKRTAVSENAKQIGIHLSNLHGIEAHRPDEIVEALKTLTPADVIPFRPLIGA